MSAISNASTSIRAQQWQEFWFYFSASKTAVAGLIFLILVILMALFADVISPHGPAEQFREFAKLPPAWMEDGQLQFFLGTDYAGRDMLSRIIHGSRLSLLAGCVVVVLSMSIGVLLGLIAGYRGGWIETLIMRVMDTIMAVPGLLLALVLVAILGPGLLNAMVAIAITYTPSFVRLTRASTLIELNRDYVTASKVAGAGPARLMFISILPNCMAPIIVQGTLSFSTAILDTAALGFLGMGAQAPIPEWGTIIAENRDLIMSAPWTVTFPGIAILLAVLAINLVGDGLRDALDPKLKRS
ncbi:MAG: ABC transporter permease subunit [Gammaproteobacteria bacterium]|jgi:dipeptide transport system permease protein|nr:ABC transporter permease subunit [Gammaproteobacteria bacterium]MBT4245620.1 ABC transporter permease subunit [Gammaproteobacteria bacterium]MBT8008750.1 ABC transporter permease subunit [Gammaproteobacteria bacterium]